MDLGYARVSTADQVLDAQIAALTGAGVDPSRIYTDRISGAKAERPGLAELMRSLRPGDVVVVYRLDRLGRSLLDLLDLVRRIEAAGAGLRSLHETLDTTTPTGRLLFHLFGAIAEFERGLVRERTMAGLAAARVRGAKPGRKSALTAEKLQLVRVLWADPTVPVVHIVKEFRVSRRTLYRELGPRTAHNSDGGCDADS
ncbi:helix-turn-helix domain-containing protein [Azospirillum formosense]|uniref:Helix-turn-helix domain-containing protein n=1 Tax=Azospirillum formosense TaxID=861533 RepID=A0ABX2KWL2_9PROT|nr:recombinase family protein [Azospirillum formosense]NUB18605.1 helix-turn-helix domain-containing protein [Azospirillum formosense]